MKYQNTKEVYTDGSKIRGKKIDFSVVSTDITGRRALIEEASIHTAEITAIKIAVEKILKKEDKQLFKALFSRLNTTKKSYI